MPVRSSRPIARSRAALPRSLSCNPSTSTICAPTVCSGLSAVIGSWKIIAILPPRIACSFGSERARRSVPSKTIRPPVSAPSTSPSTESAVIDLPEPDSPTSANFSPAAIVKDTSSTTAFAPKRTVRCSIASSGAGLKRTSRARSRSGGCRLRGRAEELAAGRALVVAARWRRAQLAEFGFHARHRRAVRAALVPRLQLLADLLQRAAAAHVERVRLRSRLAPELRRRRFDRLLVVRRELDERDDVARAPLQPRRRPFALVVRLAVPAQCFGLVAALLGVHGELGHQVVRRMALREVGLEQRVGLVAESGALEQVRIGGDHRLALVAVGDLAVVARDVFAHLGDELLGQVRLRTRRSMLDGAVVGFVD